MTKLYIGDLVKVTNTEGDEFVGRLVTRAQARPLVITTEDDEDWGQVPGDIATIEKVEQ